MDQVAECLPSKCKALSSNSSTTRDRERDALKAKGRKDLPEEATFNSIKCL
jgi:hypothetical protein